MKKRWIPQERRTGIMITSSILCPARLLPSWLNRLIPWNRKINAEIKNYFNRKDVKVVRKLFLLTSVFFFQLDVGSTVYDECLCVVPKLFQKLLFLSQRFLSFFLVNYLQTHETIKWVSGFIFLAWLLILVWQLDSVCAPEATANYSLIQLIGPSISFQLSLL